MMIKTLQSTNEICLNVNNVIDEVVPFLQNMVHGRLNNPVPIHVLHKAMPESRVEMD